MDDGKRITNIYMYVCMYVARVFRPADMGDE